MKCAILDDQQECRSEICESLRRYAKHRMPAETLQLALRVAPRVVIKERSEYILREYGCEEFIGGKYSRIKYGIIKR